MILSRKLCSLPTETAAEKAGRKTWKVLKVKANRPIIQKHRLINEDHENKAKAMGLGWRIVSARYPNKIS